MPLKNTITLVLFSFAAVLLFVDPAYAYLDPGTGSLILQVIVGAMVGAAAMIKVFWVRIVSLFHRKEPDKKEDAS